MANPSGVILKPKIIIFLIIHLKETESSPSACCIRVQCIVISYECHVWFVMPKLDKSIIDLQYCIFAEIS